jgi:hypothetical protein
MHFKRTVKLFKLPKHNTIPQLGIYLMCYEDKFQLNIMEHGKKRVYNNKQYIMTLK